MLYASIVEEMLHNIHNLSELRKDQYLMTCLNELWEDPIQELKLSTASENVIS
jgi:hypothetical protein